MWWLLNVGAVCALICVSTFLVFYHRTLLRLSKVAGTGNAVEIFKVAQELPLGNFLADFVIGFYSPYTGTISPHFIELTYKKSVISITERRKIRNPFSSIHAAALINLGEFVIETKRKMKWTHFFKYIS